MNALSLTGKLLVATPTLEDPNFHRTVVLMLAHTDEGGAMGVVLNRPSELEVADPLPEWSLLATNPDVMFIGGPVQPEAIIGLGRSELGREADGWARVVGPVGVVDLSRGPDSFATTLTCVRLFAGYAGWGSRQLEGEIAAGGWFVVDALPDDAVAAEPDELWRAVLRRQSGKLALFANAPPHLSLN